MIILLLELKIEQKFAQKHKFARIENKTLKHFVINANIN